MARRKSNNKNRKRHTEIPYPGPLLSVLIAVAVVALAYLQLCGRCETLGKDVNELEMRRSEISRRLNIEKSKWARNERIDGIKKGLARWGIEMELPPSERIVFVEREELLDQLVPNEDRGQYAYVVRSGYE